jgi:hypothetical protein
MCPKIMLYKLIWSRIVHLHAVHFEMILSSAAPVGGHPVPNPEGDGFFNLASCGDLVLQGLDQNVICKLLLNYFVFLHIRKQKEDKILASTGLMGKHQGI